MKKKIEKKGEAKKGRPIILFRLDRIEIDTFGRVIIKDPWLTQRIKELKAKRKKFLAVNALCLPDSYCPKQVSGDSCGSGGGVSIPLIDCKCPPPPLDTVCPLQVSGDSCGGEGINIPLMDYKCPPPPSQLIDCKCPPPPLETVCPPQVSGDNCGAGGGVTVPIPLIGCKCPPPDNLCTCVAQCGCSLTLCD